ncbi:5-formyltetrahydrofolate cyclo-ligase [Glutamicibacter arilaitensis]|uniref:5-formyltetrahydrofolate cyclo-ligase n=1 Tax=Glutamicibacter arilaitensis TaxID=256701 RepID=UPI003FD0D87F
MDLTADQNHSCDKKSARAAVRTWRRNLDTDKREQLGQELAQTVIGYLSQSTGVVQKVAAYCSASDEPSTEPLLAALISEGIEVYLPVCEPGYALSWVEYSPGMEFQPSTMAPVMEPVGEKAGTELFEQINTLIMPALSIDSNGLRLGQGGGYYDRFLPLIADAPVRVAAVVYEHEFVAAGTFDVDPHDQPVDLVFTPQQVHQII